MYFEEVALGFSVSTEPVEVKEQDMIAFAQTYDRIPLHTDEAYAKTTQFKGLIASGFYSALLVYGMFTENHVWQGGHIAGNMTKFDFPAPVYAGDTLRGVFTVTGKTPRGAHKGIIEETMEVFNQNDVLVVRGVSNKYLKTKPAEPIGEG